MLAGKVRLREKAFLLRRAARAIFVRMKIAILTTGGTIEKTFNEADGSLRNAGSVLEDILAALRLPEVELRHISIMSKDSLDMTDSDRDIIVQAAQDVLATDDAALVVHGTDTLSVTGEHLHQRLKPLKKPIILTGAMRPFEFRDTDAFQNLTEALLACKLLSPGVYVVMHNQALKFPGVMKDRSRGTFVRSPAP